MLGTAVVNKNIRRDSIEFNVQLDTVFVISETVYSANHVTDTSKTEPKYNQLQLATRNLSNHWWQLHTHKQQAVLFSIYDRVSEDVSLINEAETAVELSNGSPNCTMRKKYVTNKPIICHATNAQLPVRIAKFCNQFLFTYIPHGMLASCFI